MKKAVEIDVDEQSTSISSIAQKKKNKKRGILARAEDKINEE